MAPRSPRRSKKLARVARERLQWAHHSVAMYRAVLVAHGSLVAIADSDKRIRSSIPDIVQSAREQMELEEAMLGYDARLFKIVDDMTRQEKVDLVFELFDISHRNELGVTTLDLSLQKLRIHGVDYPSAEELVDIFASRRGGDLLKEDFESVIDALAASSKDCDFDDMVQLMLRFVVFAVGGSSVVEEAVIYVAGNSGCRLEEAISEARLMLLFNAMDQTQSGFVYLKDVVKNLYHVTQDLCPLQRESLLKLRDKSHRKLDYELFSEIILNVTESLPRASLNEIANALTLSMANKVHGDMKNDEVSKLFIPQPGSHGSASLSSFSSLDSNESNSFNRSYEASFSRGLTANHKTGSWSSAGFTASYTGMMF